MPDGFTIERVAGPDLEALFHSVPDGGDGGVEYRRPVALGMYLSLEGINGTVAGTEECLERSHLMDGAELLRTSEFADAMIGNM